VDGTGPKDWGESRTGANHDRW